MFSIIDEACLLPDLILITLYYSMDTGLAVVTRYMKRQHDRNNEL